MSIFSKFSPLAHSAIIYVTVGALTVVWSGIWFVYLCNNLPGDPGIFYWCYGFLLTGLTLSLIGLGIGWIGRSVHPAELRRMEVPPAVTQAEPTAVAKAPLIAVVNPQAGPAVAPNNRIAAIVNPVYRVDVRQPVAGDSVQSAQ